ncbi:hypothetical protein G6L26_019510 [Agrobacterium radiobacter]|jgi:hypothetical protein|uniref:Uncharacterized protein n=3 Tax=Agrobacterium tumefaciens complex TaxID=1183400 RepID=A0AAP9E8G6_AGRTU|nr:MULTISPECIES: hypothetical protein [Agrobacterium]EPR20879.1 hypothetical protein L902_28300 [Agrobacterium radiobacter DSM 30147]KAB0461739.1 hypothetical protein F7R04_08185 [Agrobacterium tumefaciens]KWT78027.1 hypothetical protein ASH09_10725 [Agrobacterium radiobacter]KWT88418.1 hypothetical protein ASB65_17065 [Agrobacterium tumefaciens str. B6]MBB4282709.1 hypothetical protein [Agrobacterium radiobacter]
MAERQVPASFSLRAIKHRSSETFSVDRSNNVPSSSVLFAGTATALTDGSGNFFFDLPAPPTYPEKAQKPEKTDDRSHIARQ